MCVTEEYDGELGGDGGDGGEIDIGRFRGLFVPLPLSER